MSEPRSADLLTAFTAEDLAVVSRWLGGVTVGASLNELRVYVWADDGNKYAAVESGTFAPNGAVLKVLGLLRALAGGVA